MSDLSKETRAAIERIRVLEDPARLRNMIANARRLKNAEVEREAFNRLCVVQPEATPGTVEFDVWRAIHALEEMFRDERGKTVRLTRTRQKITKDGEARTVSDLVLKPEASAGFPALVERGFPGLTFEAVVLSHPKTFDDEIQQAAKDRLHGAGVDMSELLGEKES
ncbi:hypothetical protein AIOL_002768 [Candidatus Rhodobacter oscarellae]|uniref:Uncharacterized protein n=1 Tax=Candidatus Rhodobacter oscarellae TaxID=1675527 RepID=A0A0J9E4S6_9RHOB|nr:hypothetical protein [Candidatus Rhodobacter lobularis]KMW57800.1 hypothetical protein AIOL_002768 [Candidatus Rhodobacter lobularis]